MSVFDKLVQWFSIILEPMQEFGSHAQNMNSIHSNAMQQFHNNINPLQENTILNGDLAKAINNSANDFIALDLQLSLAADELDKLASISADFQTAINRIMTAIDSAAAKIEGDSILTEITTDVDAAAVIEGGANPIADVAGIILTIIDGALVIDTLKDLGENVYETVKDLKQDLTDLAYAIDPPTPPEPKPIAKTPSWQNNPVSQQDLQTLQQTYGNLAHTPEQQQELDNALKGLLQKGLTPQQINSIMTKLQATGCSDEQILTFLGGLVREDPLYPNSPSASQIIGFINSTSGRKKYTLQKYVQQYSEFAQIPGANRLLERLIVSIQPGTNVEKDAGSKGYNYEWNWVLGHKDQIARIEDAAPNASGTKNEQAADIVMKSGPFTQGAVVDVKNFSWSKFDTKTDTYRPLTSSELRDNLKDTLKQVKRDITVYNSGGHKYPIVYCFDSHGGKDAVPQTVVDALYKQGVTYVMSSPPDKVYQPSPDVLKQMQEQQAQQQPAINNTSATKESIENIVGTLRKIATGGGETPQLPGPGPIALP